MDDPEARDPNRTMQVDALSDVELLDQDADSSEGEALPSASPGRAPPPLPYRRPSVIAIVAVVVLAGILGAAGSFLIPSAEPAATPTAAPPSATEAPSPEPAAAETEEVRHVPLGEEFIIRFDEDAGLPPSE